jgi:hypothetical protein
MCPDFPKPAGAGATAAEVWNYATRELTGFTGTPRSDLIGANESLDAHGYTSARAAKMDMLDAAISSRSSHSAADVWAVASRTLTELKGQPRTDLLGEDASFEAGTGARKARIDRLDSIPAFETPVEQSVAMDGTEKTLVEKTDSKLGLLDGYIDLTPMQAGDTIVIRQYMQVKAAGSYVKYAEETYSGAQSIPLLHITTKPAKDKIKVTAQQTAGTNRTLDVQFYRRKVA